jgi:hypothetical protein
MGCLFVYLISNLGFPRKSFTFDEIEIPTKFYPNFDVSIFRNFVFDVEIGISISVSISIVYF